MDNGKGSNMETGIVEYTPKQGEGEVLDPTALPDVLAEMGESAENLERLGERPPHLPIRTWVKVACVLGIQEWMIRHGISNVARACEGTGWQRWTYEHAIRDTAVIDYVTAQNFRTDALGARKMEEAWLSIVEAQINLALNTEQGQAATRAATWVAEQRRRFGEAAQQVAHDAEQQEGSSRLERIASRFGAVLQEKVTTTRTVKLPGE